MPTLEEVLKLAIAAPNMQLHIEMKGPGICEELIARYDYRLAAEMVKDLIDKYKI